MPVVDTFALIEASPVGAWMRAHAINFPLVEALHVCFWVLLGGAEVLVGLSLLGLGIKSPPGEILRAARPWLIAALCGLLSTGFLLFCSEAGRLYGNPAFRLKMAALAGAILFTFLVREPLAKSAWIAGGKLAAVVSLALWFLVALCGRTIGIL